MPLTNAVVRAAKPGVAPDGRQTDKPYKMADGGGLYLEVAPSGGKWWRLNYRFGGKEKRLALGVYDKVTLADARKRRDEARDLLAKGIDPGEHRKLTKNKPQDADSFEAVAREWFAKFAPGWAATHGEKIIRRLERDVFPWIGTRPVGEINAPELLAALRQIEARGQLETAHRAHQNCGQVSAMPWRPDAPSVTLPATCAAPWRPGSRSTTRPLPTRRP